MALSWRVERAGPDNPLPRHPAAHWWYTLEDEDRRAGGERDASLLALNLDLPRQGGAGTDREALCLMSPAQAQALHRGVDVPDRDALLDQVLAQARDGVRDRTLFAPVLPEQARCRAERPSCAGPVEMPQVPGDSTIIGIIDDGIAFAHPRFRMPGERQTRFAAVWQQDGTCLRGGASDVPFGHVFSRAEIDHRLADAAFDEDRFYRGLPAMGRAGRPPFGRRRQHGTHVADLAAGTGRGDAIDATPEKFPILAVNLPTALVSDTGATFMASAMILGLRDIMYRTETMMKGAGSAFPLVVNLSFGLGGIGKNGGHLVAAALEQAVDYWHATHGVPMRVVLPAGNTLQSRLTARAEVAPGKRYRARLRVAPENLGPTYLEIAVADRGQKPDVSALVVKVTPPGGAEIRPPAMPAAPRPMDSVLHLVETSADLADGGLVQCGVYHGFQLDFAPVSPSVAGEGVEIVTVALPPNAARDPGRPLPPCGDWQVDVSLAPGEHGPRHIELRVLRNDVPNHVVPIRQKAALLDPHYRSFDADGQVATDLDTPTCAVRRRGTLNALSGGARIVTVGASRGDRDRLSDYSSAGPGGPLAEGATVTLHACADDSAVRPGRLAAGSRAGSHLRLSGTSVAAALVSRRLLLALAGWTQAPTQDPAAFAPASDLVGRGPYLPKERAGAGGLVRGAVGRRGCDPEQI